jgi:hypothetical protein
MALKHKVCIRVQDANGAQEPVVTGGTVSLPRRFLRWLIGEPANLLVLTPGQSVASVEIYEDKEDDGNVGDERNQYDHRGTAHGGERAHQRGGQPAAILQQRG